MGTERRLTFNEAAPGPLHLCRHKHSTRHVTRPSYTRLRLDREHPTARHLRRACRREHGHERLEVAHHHLVPELAPRLFRTDARVERLNVRHVAREQLRALRRDPVRDLNICRRKKAKMRHRDDAHDTNPGGRTQELLVLTHEVLHEPAREHEIVDLLWGPREDGVHGRLGVMSARLAALALRDLDSRRTLLRRRPNAVNGPPIRHAALIALFERAPGAYALRAHRRVFGAGKTPDVVEDVEGGVTREEGGEGVLRGPRRQLDRVWDHKRRHPLLKRDHLVHRDGELCHRHVTSPTTRRDRQRAREGRRQGGKANGTVNVCARRRARRLTSVIHPKMFAWKQTWFSEMYSRP